jgi:hypothetical protein
MLIDASNVLNKLGLVNDAMAGGTGPLVTIETFTGSQGGAVGQFKDALSLATIPFNLNIGDCSEFSINCTKKACTFN